MRQSLTIHPDTPCDAVASIEAELVRPGPDRLALRYVVTGAIEALRLPEPTRPAPADDLWRRTCFEAFFRAPDDSYLELNLSPSTQWAAYAFSGYREPISGSWHGDPGIAVTTSDQRFELSAVIDLPAANGWICGLAAVIEEADGRLSYWALAHPPGAPDFHHPDGFALVLPGA